MAPGARWPFWLRCRWPDGSDGSGRKSPDASENARSGATTGSGNRAVAGHGSADPVQEGLPIRIFIFTPFIALLLVMVGATAIVALQTADDDARMLATRLHQACRQTSACSSTAIFAASPPPRAEREDPLSPCCEARLSAPMVAPSSLIQPAKWSPRPCPPATRWWRARLRRWRGTPVHRACLQQRRNSSSITSRRSRSHGKPG